MRAFFSLLAIALTLGLTLFLNTRNPLGIDPLPPLGKVLNPFTGFWQNAEQSQPRLPEEIKLDGLSGPVQVAYDDRMVPHIFAQNIRDAYMVQGYLGAQNRLWQMDLSSRSASGRISEILGPVALEYDRLQRRKGIPMAAENALRGWARYPDSLALFEAYAQGVNAYVDQLRPADYPLEFKLIDYHPEHWSPLKSAMIIKSMAVILSMGEKDLASTNALSYFGREAFDFLYPLRNQADSPVIPAGTPWDFTPLQPEAEPSNQPAATRELYGHLPYPDHSDENYGIGSNNWAVSGAKTASGYPILCNDPHLILNLPSLWMEVQIHTPEFNVYGVALPGIPGVFIGFNEYLAWGLTNTEHDVLDWYRIQWVNPEKTVYLFDGEERASKKVVEIIEVRGEKTVLDTVIHTHLGPIVYTDPVSPQADLAMNWMAHQTSESFDMGVISQINSARTYEDYRKAASSWVTPGQNVVYAHKNGDIALTVMGRMPLKRYEHGRFVLDGSSSGNLWKQTIPYEHQPHVKNPPRGFVSSANQISTDSTYPYYYHGKFYGFRGTILNRALERMDSIDLEDMMALQTSNYLLMAEIALPAMLAQTDQSKLTTVEKGLFKLLQEWNYLAEANRPAPVLFDGWWKALDTLLWDEVYNRLDSIPLPVPEKWKTAEMIASHPLNRFWDIETTPETETPQMVVTQAFKKMATDLEPNLDKVDYNWGKYRAFQIQHLGRLAPFSSDTLYTSGHPDALNAIKIPPGPSWRMIVELGPEVKGYGVFPGGQSGNPGSHYYDNAVDAWANGRYFELFFMKDAADNRKPVLFTQTFRS